MHHASLERLVPPPNDILKNIMPSKRKTIRNCMQFSHQVN
jgi:hypothetical protein